MEIFEYVFPHYHHNEVCITMRGMETGGIYLKQLFYKEIKIACVYI